MSDGSVSKEISDILTWIAGHDGTCKQRHEAILQAFKDFREDIAELKNDHKTFKSNMKTDMKAADAVLGKRIVRTEAAVKQLEKDKSWRQGAAAALGGLLGVLLIKVVLGILGIQS